MNGRAPAGPAASRRSSLQQRWSWRRCKDRLCPRKNERRQINAYTAWGRSERRFRVVTMGDRPAIDRRSGHRGTGTGVRHQLVGAVLMCW